MFDVVGHRPENLLMAATLRGRPYPERRARAEVVDLAECLVAMGACIAGAGTDRIVIEGVDRLHGASHRIMPDRIEAGTFLAAVAAAGGEATLTDARPSSLESVIDKLAEAGATISTTKDTIRISRKGALVPTRLRTAPYPAFPTDMQAQFMALATRAGGTRSPRRSSNRMMRAGAEATRRRHRVEARPRSCAAAALSANVMATDLRVRTS